MKIATDIGGTFTDLAYIGADQQIHYGKTSTTTGNYEKGIINVINESGLDKKAMDSFIHGTTVIINALTERKGAKTGLITTKGFRDVLEIARGNRPDLFNVQYKKPQPFVARYLRLEVDERLDYQGEVIRPLKESDIQKAVEFFKEQGVESIAVSFLHAYKNDSHERQAVKLIKELWPEVYVSASSKITKEYREYERTNTAVFNAYVKPTANRYIDRLEKELDQIADVNKKYIMQSNGGTATFDYTKELPINMVESGPVAGIYGSSVIGDLIGEKNIIAFDVGGTTAKCALIEDGKVKTSTDYFIEKDSRQAGYPIKVPVVDIVEIGNGGGSIAWVDEGKALKVGPQSAGAIPGPVAYNQGGTQPTTTDANIVTHRLSTKNFDYAVDSAKIKAAIDKTVAKPFNVTTEEAALGIIRIANSNMLNALKLVSVRRGYDPTDFVLLAFGGGGSMHAAALALELGIDKVVIPVASPVFSAWSMLMTDLRQDYIQTDIQAFDSIDPEDMNQAWQLLEEKGRSEFEKQGIPKERLSFQHFLDMRYEGQEHTVKVPITSKNLTKDAIPQVIADFHKTHEKAYSFKLEETPVEIVNYHLTVVGEVDKPEIPKLHQSTTLAQALIEERQVYFEKAGWVQTKVYDRSLLPVNVSIQGPVVVEEKAATTVVYDNQKIYQDAYGNLIIEKVKGDVK